MNCCSLATRCPLTDRIWSPSRKPNREIGPLDETSEITRLLRLLRSNHSPISAPRLICVWLACWPAQSPVGVDRGTDRDRCRERCPAAVDCWIRREWRSPVRPLPLRALRQMRRDFGCDYSATGCCCLEAAHDRFDLGRGHCAYHH